MGLRIVLLLPLLLMLLGQAPRARRTPDGMVLVPEGDFVMGCEVGAADEAPEHRVHLSAFYIDRHEVTNAAFAAYVRATGRFDSVEGPWFRYSAEGCLDLIAHYEGRHGAALEDLDGRRGDVEPRRRSMDAARWGAALAALRAMLGEGFAGRGHLAALERSPQVRELIRAQATLPVRGVTWRDAAAYARWAGKRLPTEAEWEKAARGTDGRLYPWGSVWDPMRCRAGLEPEAGPAPVGSHPAGASPYGCLDMAGNVWEWVADWYGEDEYGSSRDAVDPQGPEGLPEGRLPAASPGVDLLRSTLQGRESDTRKVIRGGAWSGPGPRARFDVRCTRRLWSNPAYWHLDVGFRCAKNAR